MEFHLMIYWANQQVDFMGLYLIAISSRQQFSTHQEVWDRLRGGVLIGIACLTKISNSTMDHLWEWCVTFYIMLSEFPLSCIIELYLAKYVSTLYAISVKGYNNVRVYDLLSHLKDQMPVKNIYEKHSTSYTLKYIILQLKTNDHALEN